MAATELFNIVVKVVLPANLGKPPVNAVSFQRVLEGNATETYESKPVQVGLKEITFNLQKEVLIRDDGHYEFRVVAEQPIWGKKTWWSQKFVIDKTTGTLGVDMSTAGQGTAAATLQTNLLTNYTKLKSGNAVNDERYSCDDVHIPHPETAIRRVNLNVSSAGVCANICSKSPNCNFMQYDGQQTCVTYEHATLNKIKVARYATAVTEGKAPVSCYVKNGFYKALTSSACEAPYKTTTLGCAPGWKWGVFGSCDEQCGKKSTNAELNAWKCRYCSCACDDNGAASEQVSTPEKEPGIEADYGDVDDVEPAVDEVPVIEADYGDVDDVESAIDEVPAIEAVKTPIVVTNPIVDTQQWIKSQFKSSVNRRCTNGKTLKASNYQQARAWVEKCKKDQNCRSVHIHIPTGNIQMRDRDAPGTSNGCDNKNTDSNYFTYFKN